MSDSEDFEKLASDSTISKDSDDTTFKLTMLMLARSTNQSLKAHMAECEKDRKQLNDRLAAIEAAAIEEQKKTHSLLSQQAPAGPSPLHEARINDLERRATEVEHETGTATEIASAVKNKLAWWSGVIAGVSGLIGGIMGVIGALFSFWGAF